MTPPHATERPAPASLLSRTSAVLGNEVVGGVLLLAATMLALILANTAADQGYFNLRETYVGPILGPVDLNMSLAHWAADGLLAVFFFLAGLELKREIVAGDLRDMRTAAVPVAAATGGIVVPALIYVLMNRHDPDALTGWAIPAATDIAFALAVLAVVGRGLPRSVRTFLLTLAVVDDLIAIVIIAVVYTESLQIGFLAAALVPTVLYAIVASRYRQRLADNVWLAWVTLLPLGIATWALVYCSGIHATMAGVLLAFTVPVVDKQGRADHGLAEILEHRYRPLSAGLCVPLFAFMSVGVGVGGVDGLVSAFESPVFQGIVIALVVGKVVGITGATFAITRLRGIRLDPLMTFGDVIGVAFLAGIGFTVSLLITELSFAASPLEDVGKVGVLIASLIAAIAGGVVLTARKRTGRTI